MNHREIVLANIEEAREQLQAIETALMNPDYSEVEFKIELEHAYHHLNYAWNIRNEEDIALDEHSQANYAKSSKFPVGEIQEYE
jgi:hypothetical protein